VPTACGDGGYGVHCRVPVTFGGDLDNRVEWSRSRYFSPLVLLTAPRPPRSAPRPSPRRCDFGPDLDTSLVALHRSSPLFARPPPTRKYSPASRVLTSHCLTANWPNKSPSLNAPRSILALARRSSTMASPATTPRDKQPSSRMKIGPVVLSADSKTAICGVKLTRVRPAPTPRAASQTTVARRRHLFFRA